ncbi:hypothetical protein RBH94_16025 [Aestuariibaculum sp. YM273]|uniref:hypothetical protein n=1 Tax=Aestuariibaculum sp. YM273 TaxID=3070659 RepID=UPI0027DDE8FA|nr:hypothetical protein [Aestuariibaculum sp. YM273]WMI65559.1 hypothetical protein RBH94_16025 [Aestuariibaculum sp. YM273]
MLKSKIIEGLVILIYILFVLFQFTGHDDLAYYSSSLILPVITFIYFIKVKDKSLFFTLFLVLFSVSDILVFFEQFDIYKHIDYYFGNGLYILSYACLLIEICKSIKLKYLIKNYYIHLLVLSVLSVYIVYVLQNIVKPFVVTTDEFYMELVYNVILLSLLSVALLGYFYKDNVKALYLFIGVLCVVFAEVMWVAYTYIAERNLLNLLSTTLYLVGFYFFYKQSKLLDEKNEGIEMVSQEI